MRRKSGLVEHATLLHAPWPPPVTPAWAGALLAGLPYAWRLELERRAPEARLASLAGLALMLCGVTRLQGVPPAVRDLSRDAEGKPRLAAGPHFSVSHGATRVAAVVTQGCEVGLDLESLGATSDPRELRRGTATEAALKAAGLGLRAVAEVQVVATGEEAVVRGRRYRVRPVELAPDVIASVAAEWVLQLDCGEMSLDAPELSTTVERSLGLATQR